MKIGIMAALQQEIADLLTLMGPQMQVTRIGQRDYYQGQIGQHECVVVLARIGKVAASATCVTLIREFNVEQIVFTGLAGGISEHVHVGDIVIATELMQHDFDASPIFPRYEIPLLGRAHFAADERMSQELLAAAKDYLNAENGLVRDVSSEVMQQFGLRKERAVTGAETGDLAGGELSGTGVSYGELSGELAADLSGGVLASGELAGSKASATPAAEQEQVHSIHIHQGVILSGDQFVSAHNHAEQLSQEHPQALCTEMEGAAIAQICYEYDVPFSVLRVISDKANDDASVDFDSFLNHVARYVSSGILMRWLGVV